jgi:hypothetical protein
LVLAHLTSLRNDEIALGIIISILQISSFSFFFHVWNRNSQWRKACISINVIFYRTLYTYMGGVETHPCTEFLKNINRQTKIFLAASGDKAIFACPASLRSADRRR